MSYRLSVKDFQLKKTGASDISTLKILTGTSGTSQIYLGDTAVESVGLIKYNHLTDTFSVNTNSTERLSINSSGAVNIASTSTTTGQLNIYGNLLIERAGARLDDIRNAYTTTQYVLNSYARSKSDTYGAHAALASGDVVYIENHRGSDGTNFQIACQIKTEIDAAVSSGIVPGRLVFSTNSTLGVLSERMRIDSAGNVGIGVTPAYKFQVNNTVSATAVNSAFLHPNLANGNYGQIYLGRSAASNDLATISYVPNVTAASSTLRLGLYGSSDTLAINGSGNVGIGATSPAVKLHVQESTIIGFTQTTGNVLRLDRNGATNIQINSHSATAGSIFFGHDGSYLRGYMSYDHTSNSLQFGTSGSEKMRIDSAGNIGIGVTPSYKLHISQSVAGQADSLYLINSNGAQSDSVAIGFSNTQATFLSKIVGYVGDTGNNGGGFKIQLRNGNTGAMYDGVMFKDNAGSPLVGIGIVPTDVLHIYKSTGIACLHSQGDQCGSKWSTTAGTLKFITGLRSDIHAANYVFHSYGSNWTFYNAKVAIGATDPTNGQLHVNGSVSYTPATYSGAGTNTTWSTGMTAAVNSSIWASNSLVASGVYSYSDKRMKKDIETISSEEASNFIRSAIPSKFKWISSNADDYGFIAQDILKIGFNNLVGAIPEENLPELVEEDFISPADKKLIVKYEAVIPILTKALQDLKKEFDDFKAKHS